MQTGQLTTCQVTYERVSKATVLGLLREHLTRNVVRMGREWHRQTRGIAQVRCSRPMFLW